MNKSQKVQGHPFFSWQLDITVDGHSVNDVDNDIPIGAAIYHADPGTLGYLDNSEPVNTPDTVVYKQPHDPPHFDKSNKPLKFSAEYGATPIY